MIAYTELHA